MPDFGGRYAAAEFNPFELADAITKTVESIEAKTK